MKIRSTELKIKPFGTKLTYLALDGKEFDTMGECLKYDNKIRLKEFKEEIPELKDGITVGNKEVYIPGHYDTKQYYFASDGKSFENYFECLTYNESITGINKLKFKKITESYNEDETFDGAYFCNNQEEFDMLINFYKCVELSPGDNDFKGPGWYLIKIEEAFKVFTRFSVSSVDERLDKIAKFEKQFIDWCGI